MVLVPAVVALLPLLAGAPATAPSVPPAVQDLLDDAEYQKARKLMDRLLRSADLPTDQRVVLYGAHATCDVSLGDELAAAQAFQKLLTLRPDYRPDPARTSPKVLEVFQLVRDRMQEQGALDIAYGAEFQPLPDQAPGEDVPVKVAFKGAPAQSVHRLFIRYRRVGDASFESAELVRQPPAVAFAGVIPKTALPADEDDYAVDYFLDAQDAQGERLTGVGTAALPLQFRVSRPETAGGAAAAGGSTRKSSETAMKVVNIVVPIVVGAAAVAAVAGVTAVVLALTALDPGASHLWVRRFQ